MIDRRYTIREIAEALGEGKRKIERRAARYDWPYEEAAGPGGRRRLYALSDLPVDVQIAVLKKFGEEEPQPSGEAEIELTEVSKRGRVTFSEKDLNEHWARLREGQREKAIAKCKVIRAAVTVHEREGVPLTVALKEASEGTPWSYATLRDCYYGKGTKAGLMDYPRHLWPLVLAPRHRGRVATAECDPAAWEAWKADYLRLEAPPLEMTYRTLQRLAEKNGWVIPDCARTLKRRLDREMSKRAQVFMRKGKEAVERMFPAQLRDRSSLRAMELVNADGHQFDVFVKWPEGDVSRPIMVGWQDIRSGKILAWRVDKTENSDGYRLSFADLLEKYGIPGGAILDNGRGAASKILTGGMSTRYRFKRKEEEPLGLFTQLLGEENVHFTQPYHGQSKPIERAFRDLATDVSKDVRLAGAYTGNNPQAKPENYGSKAVPIDRFLEVLEDGIRLHNARRGRSGMGMWGRSFDEVFSESYSANSDLIPKPTSAQLSRWLLAAVDVTANKLTGAVRVYGNEYVSDALTDALAGRSASERRVVVRLDPDNLKRPVVVETLDGRLIGEARLNGPVAYLDSKAARDHAREKRRLARLAKEEAEIHQRMASSELERLLDDAAEPESDIPDGSKVVRGAFGKEKRRDEDLDLLVSNGDEMILAVAEKWRPNILEEE